MRGEVRMYAKWYYWLYYFISVLSSAGIILFVLLTHKNIYDKHGLPIISLVFFVMIMSVHLFVLRRNRMALKKSIENYQNLLNISPNGIIVYDKERIVYVNETFVQLIKGKSKKELIGKPISEILEPSEYGKISAAIEKIFQGEQMGYVEIQLNFRNASVDVEVVNIATTYNGKKVIMSILRDVSERKRMEAELIEAENKYRSIVEGALVGVYLIQNGKMVYVNKYYEDTFGYSADEIYHMDFLDLIAPEFRNTVMENIQKLQSGEQEVILELNGIKKDGNIIHLKTYAKSVIYNGSPAIIGTVLDITEQKKSEETIRQMALYDSVTGLPNRYYLSSYLHKSLQKSDVENTPVALLFIDFDRFKIINDTLGHTFGDKVLERVSTEMEACLKEEDFLARYAGDEFIVILDNGLPERAGEVAGNIIKRFSDSLNIEGQMINTTPSIGISFYPIDADDVETLLKNADIAMYQAKAQGRNNFQFYTPDMHFQFTQKIEMEGALRKALQNDEFVIHYQPLIDLKSGGIYGAEALIRWKHPKFGLVRPDVFIPIAEETGLVVPIGDWVLKTACMQSKAWRDSGLPPIHMAVNISYHHLKHEGFISSIRQVLKETEMEPQYLELEMTEDALKDGDELKCILEIIASIGVKISIDDFGLGCSSFNILQNIAINNLKIDKSITKNIARNSKAEAIVKTIIELGKNLNCKIIAEGIEEKEQVDLLAKYHCDIGQGFLFSKPLESEEFVEFYRAWKCN